MSELNYVDLMKCRIYIVSLKSVLAQGVLMSQDNITWTCASAAATYRLREGSEVLISFLPLSHIVAQVMITLKNLYFRLFMPMFLVIKYLKFNLSFVLLSLYLKKNIVLQRQ